MWGRPHTVPHLPGRLYTGTQANASAESGPAWQHTGLFARGCVCALRPHPAPTLSPGEYAFPSAPRARGRGPGSASPLLCSRAASEYVPLS